MLSKEFKRMLWKDCRNRLVGKILQLVENGQSLGALQACEEVLRLHKVEYELLEAGGKDGRQQTDTARAELQVP